MPHTPGGTWERRRHDLDHALCTTEPAPSVVTALPSVPGADVEPPSHADPAQWVAARLYVTWGWKLFVLAGEGAKSPVANCSECRDAGPGHDKEACDHLLCHGFYAATHDLKRLAAMWARVPHGVLGLRTGAASGIVVIDAEGSADTPTGTTGVDVLDDWDAWVPDVPLTPTLRACTPGGGVHLFYALDGQRADTVRSAGRVLPATDLKGRGGYVMLPPGRGLGLDGAGRRWLPGFDRPQPPGEELLAWMRTARGQRAALARGEHGTHRAGGMGPRERALAEKWAGYDFERMLRDGAPQGVQDDFLNDLVFRLVRHDGQSDPDVIFARVWPLVQAWDQDPTRPWTQFQVARKIAHVLDTVEPAAPVPAVIPRREADQVVAAWDGAPRVLAVNPGTGDDDDEGSAVLRLNEDVPDAVVAVPWDDGLPGQVLQEMADTDGAEAVEGARVIPVDFGGAGTGVGSGVGSAAVIPGGGAWPPGTGAAGGGDHIGYGGSIRDGLPGTEGMHDTGNANRLIRLHGRDMRWVENEGIWLVWDGVRWKRDHTKTVEGWTVDVMTDIDVHARSVGPEERAVWLRHMRASYAAGRRTAMLTNARRVPGVTVTSDMLDTDPWQLVVANGVLDLKTGSLSAGQRSDLNTLSAAVAYDPAARCPKWEAHVRLITRGDAEMAAYLRRLAGYSLTGLTTEQAFFSLEGVGDNGKNVFVDPLVALLGDYADPGDSKLVTYGDKTHAAIVASLVGKRLVFVDEIPAGRHMDVERVKALTSGSTMKAQFMAKDWFTFTPQVKLWLAGNAQPPIKDTSDGIWRRMHRVLFRAKVPERSKIKGYADVLFREEGPGILNWALVGLAEWVATGRLGMTQEVKESVRELREESDHVGAFLADCCEITGREAVRSEDGTWSGDWVPNTKLMAVYSAWCDGQGIAKRERVNATHLGRRLSEKGIARYRDRRDGMTARGVDGITLTVTAVQLWGSVLA